MAAAEEDGGVARMSKDLFSGAMGGIAQVLLGQPFDIVKVRLQTTQQYSGALDCASKIWKNEGPAAFYKGTLTPLIGIGACVSVQFGAFHFARRHLESRNHEADPSSQPTLSLGQFYLAGAFAGLTNTFLSSPIEHIRIRLQTQPHAASARLYTGPLDCVRKITAQAGVARGLYRGTTVTALREAQAYGCWFLTFEALMNADAERTGTPRKEIATWKVALYGGIAGEALWIASYPFDVVKSKMQTDGFGTAAAVSKTVAEDVSTAAGAAKSANPAVQPQRYPTMRAAFRETYRVEGLRGFWKGIGPTLMRAMPVSAGTFAVAELTLRWIG